MLLEEVEGMKTSVDPQEVTPFTRGFIMEVCEALRALPVVGEPVQPMVGGGGRLRVRGERYKDVSEQLTPVIVELYRKGYNREQIIEKIALMLKVGRASRYLRQLMRDAHQAYCEMAARGVI